MRQYKLLAIQRYDGTCLFKQVHPSEGACFAVTLKQGVRTPVVGEVFDETWFASNVYWGPYESDLYVPKSRKCECGSEIVGELGHSTWCPKYNGGVK